MVSFLREAKNRMPRRPYPVILSIVVGSIFLMVFTMPARVEMFEEDEVLFETGLNLCDQGKYSEALSRFERLVTTCPASSWSDDAHYLMGECELALGQVDRAIEHFKKAVVEADNPELAADAQYMIATSFADLDMTREAVAEYKCLISNFPRSVRLDAARRYIDNKQYSIERNSQDRSTSDSAADVSGTSVSAATKTEQLPVNEEIEAVLDRSPPGSEDAELYNLGLSMHSMGRISSAIIVYQRLLELYPDTLWQSDVWYMLAESYVAVGNLEKAVNAYRQVLRWSTSSTLSADAQFMLGECYMGMKQLPQALESYQLLVDNFPASDWVGDAHYMVGEVYRKLGDYQMASETFKTLVKHFPGSKWRGDIKEYLSTFKDAAYSEGTPPPTTAEARVAITSGDVEEHWLLGLRYKNHGEYRQALKEFLRVLALDPTRVEALVISALLNQQLGDLKEALPLLERAMALEPNNLEIVSLYGYLCYLAGEYVKSVEAYKKVAIADPGGQFGREANRALRRVRKKLE